MVFFLNIDIKEVPRLKCSVLVNENLDVKGFIGSVELKKSFRKKFSETLSDDRHLFTILDPVESISIDQEITKQEITYCYDVCIFGHLVENVIKQILWVASNILQKNYCLKK